MSTILVVVGLVIAGLLLLVIEVVVIPGFGVIGVLGGLAILGSGYVALTELGAAYAGLALSAGVLGAGALLWLVPRTRAGKAMVLETRTLGAAADPGLADLVGCRGVTLTPLRPAGTADIEGRTVDVISDGQYIEPNTPVEVILVEGSRVVVEPGA